METLTYNYGETPEAVIRERLDSDAGYDSEFLIDEREYENGDDIETARMFIAHMSADDLITVLNALLKSSKTDASGSMVLVFADENTDAYKLRIAILAALGIVEG